MSARTAKVVFPPPPPTANTLNDSQRQQLVKRSRKIEQIFGEVPHVLDVNDPLGPISISLPTTKSRAKRGSCEIIPSSIPTTTSVLRRSSSFSSISSSSSGHSTDSGVSFKASKTKDTARTNNDSWLDDRKAPLLAVNGTDFASVPSPKDGRAHKPSLPFLSSSPSTTSPIARSEAPDFASLLSPKGQQKKKMDRLKKTLGAGIPLDLVFGKERPAAGRPSTDRDAAAQAGLLTTSSKSKAHIKRNPRKLSRVRDSLSEDTAAIHKAARRWQRLGSPLLWLSHSSSVCSGSPSPSTNGRHFSTPPPPLPTILIAQPTSRCTRKQNALNSRERIARARLSRIAESPEDLNCHESPSPTSPSSQDLVVHLTATVHYDSKPHSPITIYDSEEENTQRDRPLSWSWRKPVPILPSDLSD